MVDKNRRQKYSVIDFDTLIERKSRMSQIQGVTGEAVENYCEPVTTLKMGYHRLSRRVNKTDIKKQNSYLTDSRDIKMSSNHRNSF